MKVQQTDASLRQEHVRYENTMANWNHGVLDHLDSAFAEVPAATEPSRKPMWTAIYGYGQHRESARGRDDMFCRAILRQSL
jgi:hypothetical protein